MKFEATLGNQTKTVEITASFGAGGHLHIYVDRNYCGIFIKRDGKWLLLEQTQPLMTLEDLNTLLKLIETNF